jgi:hypothetical protein
MSRPVLRLVRLASGALALALTFAGAAVLAHPLGMPVAQVDAATKAKAAKRFKAGEKAFKRHDYATAAQAFEEAYSIAPHPAALFNAATAHQKAGQLTRAANLCARYLRDAPENDSRREKANALIAELTPKLGRVEIEDRGALEVQLDGDLPEVELTYVDPGDHLVTGKFGDKTVQRKISVVAGSLVHVALDPPKPASAPGPNEEPDFDTKRDVEKDETAKSKGMSPTLFYVGLGATVVLGGVTIWSGLDTNKARSDYDAHPTQAGLDDGRSKQSRTNLLLGATAVVGVGTAVVGLFLTDFSKKKARPKAPDEVGLLLGPGFVGAEGVF